MKHNLLQRLFRRSNKQPKQTAPESAPRFNEACIHNRIAADFVADPTMCESSLIDAYCWQKTRILPAITMHNAATLAEPSRWWQYESETVVDRARTLVLETV